MFRTLRSLISACVLIFPLVYVGGFVYPGIFPRAIFLYFSCGFLLFLFLWHSFSKKEIIVKKSRITLALGLYILVLFITALFGPDFSQSFWSTFFRMTGLLTWLYYFGFLLVVTVVFKKEEDWQYIFRPLLISSLFLALISSFGADGLNIAPFGAIEAGGSLFGNTSYSGAFYVLAFFISIIGFSIESNKIWKWVYVVGLIAIFFNPDLFSLTTFVGMARASSLVLWAGLSVIGVLFLFHKFTSRKTTALASIFILSLITLVYIFSFISILSHGRAYEFFQEPGTARTLVWDIAQEGIKAKPLLGYGPENFIYAYQEHLNNEVITAEADTEWFDNAHNFTLSLLLESGLVGGAAFLMLFGLIVYTSLKFYKEHNKFYFLIIPFALIFHFLQTQTFFQTDSSLFLVFILLAFLVSHEKNLEFKLPSYFSEWWAKLILLFFYILSLYFFIYIPIKENLLISEISTTENRSARLNLQNNLNSLKINPPQTLQLLSDQFIDNTGSRVGVFEKAGVLDNVAGEYRRYLKAYESYYPSYQNNYKFLLEYSSLINVAYMFEVDELQKGEKLARQALNISQSFPHPYWVLAINLSHQGRNDEAITYIQKALELEQERSREIYEGIMLRESDGNRSFLYMPI